MKTIFFTVLTGLFIAFLTTSIGCIPGESEPVPAKGVVVGQVLAIDGGAIMGANVSIDAKTVTTNQYGVFVLPDIDAGDRISVNVVADGYVPNSVITSVAEEESSSVNITLSTVAYSEVIDSTVASSVSYETALGINASVSFPDNAFIEEISGNLYSGNVTVNISFFDIATEEGKSAFPGDFKALDSGGIEVFLESFGFIDVTLFDVAGNRLQLADGKTSTLTFPLNSALPNPPMMIPVWHFDTDQGYWLEEGNATLTGNSYIAKVNHFSPWNVDTPIDLLDSRLNGCVVNQNNQPLEGVRVIAEGINFGIIAISPVIHARLIT